MASLARSVVGKGPPVGEELVEKFQGLGVRRPLRQSLRGRENDRVESVASDYPVVAVGAGEQRRVQPVPQVSRIGIVVGDDC